MRDLCAGFGLGDNGAQQRDTHKERSLELAPVAGSGCSSGRNWLADESERAAPVRVRISARGGHLAAALAGFLILSALSNPERSLDSDPDPDPPEPLEQSERARPLMVMMMTPLRLIITLMMIIIIIIITITHSARLCLSRRLSFGRLYARSFGRSSWPEGSSVRIQRARERRLRHHRRAEVQLCKKRTYRFGASRQSEDGTRRPGATRRRSAWSAK